MYSQSSFPPRCNLLIAMGTCPGALPRLCSARGPKHGCPACSGFALYLCPASASSPVLPPPKLCKPLLPAWPPQVASGSSCKPPGWEPPSQCHVCSVVPASSCSMTLGSHSCSVRLVFPSGKRGYSAVCPRAPDEGKWAVHSYAPAGVGIVALFFLTCHLPYSLTAPAGPVCPSQDPPPALP